MKKKKSSGRGLSILYSDWVYDIYKYKYSDGLGLKPINGMAQRLWSLGC